MLSRKALFYLNNGYNCSQCILKAYSDIYGLKIDSQLLSVSEIINNGFGIGNMCSALVTAIIILSIHFETDVAKEKRLILLDRFHNRFKDFNCSKINSCGCQVIITEVCNVLEEML